MENVSLISRWARGKAAQRGMSVGGVVAARSADGRCSCGLRRGRSAVGRGTTGRCSRGSWRGRSAVGRWATGPRSRGSWRSRNAVGRRTNSQCSRGLWRGHSAIGVRPVQLRHGVGATRAQEAEGRGEYGDAGESASGRRAMQPGVELPRNATCGALRPSRARGSSRDGARISRAHAARCRCRQPGRRCRSSRARSRGHQSRR